MLEARTLGDVMLVEGHLITFYIDPALALLESNLLLLLLHILSANLFQAPLHILHGFVGHAQNDVDRSQGYTKKKQQKHCRLDL